MFDETPTHRKLVRIAVTLSWFTIAYNLIEGVVSIAFGVSDESIALAGFGADSLIEVASATLILWRFQGDSGTYTKTRLGRERRATLGIGCLFVLLALATIFASSIQLYGGEHPETTVPGIVISALSLSFMFFLWSAKRRIAKQLNSVAMLKDAACSLACIKLSFVLFFGSLIFALFPALWWMDASAALVLAFLIGKEGWETIRAARHREFSGGCCS